MQKLKKTISILLLGSISIASSAHAGGVSSTADNARDNISWVAVFYLLSSLTPKLQAIVDADPNSISAGIIQQLDAGTFGDLGPEETARMLQDLDSELEFPSEDTYYDLNTAEGMAQLNNIQREIAFQPTTQELQGPLGALMERQARHYDPLQLLQENNILIRHNQRYRLAIRANSQERVNMLLGAEINTAQLENGSLLTFYRNDLEGNNQQALDPTTLRDLDFTNEELVLLINLNHRDAITEPFQIVQLLAELDPQLSPYLDTLRRVSRIATLTREEIDLQIQNYENEIAELERDPTNTEINALAKTMLKKKKGKDAMKKAKQAAKKDLKRKKKKANKCEINSLNDKIKALQAMARDTENLFFELIRTVIKPSNNIESRIFAAIFKLKNRLGLDRAIEILKSQNIYTAEMEALLNNLRIAVTQIQNELKLLTDPNYYNTFTPEFKQEEPESESIEIIEEEEIPEIPFLREDQEESIEDDYLPYQTEDMIAQENSIEEEEEYTPEDYMANIRYWNELKKRQNQKRKNKKSEKKKEEEEEQNTPEGALTLQPRDSARLQEFLQVNVRNNPVLDWMLAGAGSTEVPSLREATFNTHAEALINATRIFLINTLNWGEDSANDFTNRMLEEFKKDSHFYHDSGDYPLNYMQARIRTFILAGLFNGETLNKMSDVNVVRKRMLPFYYKRLES